jgi:hypothetical protein
MANEEHLKLLLQGVNLWNQWRKDKRYLKPDLSKTNLNNLNLSGVNLSGTNLNGANLSDSNLNKANLREADLFQATLHWTKLFQAIFSHANLREANLSKAYLRAVNLQYADLRQANLQQADFQTARFINAKLDGANLTDARLWETQRSGWSIKGVICEYVYWDKDAKEKTFYQPGDFERLFSEQNKIKLFYKDGANLLEIATLPSIIKNLEAKHPGCKLSFQSIEEISGGAIATLVLEESKDIAVEEVEAIRATIQADAERDIQTLRHALDSKEIDIAQLQGEVRALDRTIKTMLSNLQPVIYINQGQVEAMGDGAHTHGNTSNQIVNAENSSVKTQIQGERNVALDGNVSDRNISTGDKSNNE